MQKKQSEEVKFFLENPSPPPPLPPPSRSSGSPRTSSSTTSTGRHCSTCVAALRTERSARTHCRSRCPRTTSRATNTHHSRHYPYRLGARPRSTPRWTRLRGLRCKPRPATRLFGGLRCQWQRRCVESDDCSLQTRRNSSDGRLLLICRHIRLSTRIYEGNQSLS